MSEKGNINFLTADGNQEHNKKYLFDYFIGIRSISYRGSDLKKINCWSPFFVNFLEAVWGVSRHFQIT
jgi:hypothetical protein